MSTIMASEIMWQPWNDLRLRLLPRRRETLDAAIFLGVNGLPHSRRMDASVSLLSDLGRGAGWLGWAAWLALHGNGRRRRAAMAGSLAMLTATAIVQGPVKRVARRQRPHRLRFAIVVGKRPTDSSFPSGHTAGSFAAAAAIGAVLPGQRLPLLGVASAVGLSRVYLGHHFPSDVLAGAALGGVAGHIAGCLLRERVGDLPAGERLPGP